MNSSTTTENTTTYEIRFKATKADIVARLLQEGKITVEECVTLLTNDSQPYIYMPYWPLNPIPWYPFYPTIY